MSHLTAQDFSGLQAMFPDFFSGLPLWICDQTGQILQTRNTAGISISPEVFQDFAASQREFSTETEFESLEITLPVNPELKNPGKGLFSCRRVKFHKRALLLFQMNRDQENHETDHHFRLMAEEFGIFPWKYDAASQTIQFPAAAAVLAGHFGTRMAMDDFLTRLSAESLTRFTSSIEDCLNFSREFRLEVLLETGSDFRWLMISGKQEAGSQSGAISGFIKDLSAEKAEKEKYRQLENFVRAGMRRFLVSSPEGEILTELGSPSIPAGSEESPGKRKIKLVDFRNQVKYVVEAETGAPALTGNPKLQEASAEIPLLPGFDESLSREEKFVSLTRTLGQKTDAQVSALGVFDGSRFEWKAWWKSPSGYALPTKKYSGEWLPDLNWLVEMESENQKSGERYWWPQEMLPFPLPDSFGKGWMLLTDELGAGSTGLIALRSRAPELLMEKKTEVLSLMNLLRDNPGKIIPGESTEVLRQEIARRDILLKEMNHRAKNNLALAASLVKMQAGYSEDKQTIRVLRETQKRLETLAGLHELMYSGSSREGSIEIQTYLTELVRGLHTGFGNTGISLELHIDEAAIPVRYATTLGLLVNEIISNAYKHAFKDGNSGILKVDFLSKGDYFKLRISDNGPGLQGAGKGEDSLGNLLIDEFVKQLGAGMEVSSHPGTSYLISIKKSNIGL